MNILAVDTSAHYASAVISHSRTIVARACSQKPLSHAETLSSLASDCLEKANIPISQINLVSVITGPGSFTGLRIGISFVMGFCRPHDIACVPISSLEAMAYAAADENRETRPALDARREQVFTALFQGAPHKWKRLEEDHIADCKTLGPANPERVVTLSSDPLSGHMGWSTTLDAQRSPLAESAAALANEYAADAIPAKQLKPSYLRASAAEERARASGGS